MTSVYSMLFRVTQSSYHKCFFKKRSRFHLKPRSTPPQSLSMQIRNMAMQNNFDLERFASLDPKNVYKQSSGSHKITVCPL